MSNLLQVGVWSARLPRLSSPSRELVCESHIWFGYVSARNGICLDCGPSSLRRTSLEVARSCPAPCKRLR